MRKEIKTGILMILTLGALIWGINYLKGKNFFSNTQSYYVIYDDVSGLLESNGVYIKGYKVGHVSDIDFSDSTLTQLRVVLAIKSDVSIPVGSRAKIYNLDLIGNKAVELEFSKSHQLYKKGDTIPGDVEFTFSEQIEPYKVQAYNLLKSLDSLSNAIIKVFNPKTINNFKETVKNLNTTTNVISESSEDIASTFHNIETITQNLKENNKKVSDILKNLNNLSDSLSKVQFGKSLNKLDKTVDETRELIAKLKDGNGTFSKLINNDSLYNNLNKTTSDLDSLINDLKMNPKRYLQFSVFGGKSKK